MPALTATIVITTIPTQAAGTPFTVSGTYQLSESTWTDQLVYEDNSGAQVPIASPAVQLGISSWSYTHPGNLPVGNHTVSVKDPLTGTVVTSNTFAVISGHIITVNAVTGAVANTPFAFTGTLGGYGAAPTLTYALTGPINGAQTVPTPVPGPASAVGYNTLTFGPNITLGQNWTNFSFFGTVTSGLNNVQNSDGSVTINPSGAATYGNNLCAAQIINGANNRLTFNGIAFGGGAYFEAVMAFNGPASFWANDIESMNGGSLGLGFNPWPGQAAGYGDWIETDFAEFDATGVYGGAIHNWYGTNSPPTSVDALSGSPFTYPAGTNLTQPNKYGFLWVPAVGNSLPPTNIATNSTVAGAVPGTPGTLPIGWYIFSNPGLTTQVVATGPSTVTSGSFVQLRIFGTGSGDFNLKWVNPPVAAIPSWNYTLAPYLSIIAGTVNNIAAPALIVDNLDSGLNYISGALYDPITLISSPSKYTGSFISAPTAAFFSYGFSLLGTSGAVDITVQIEGVQLLQASNSTAGQGYAKFFFNDVQIGNTMVWNKYDSTKSPPPMISNGTATSVMDTLHLAPILGVGTGAGTYNTVYSVGVWQANANSNISNLPAPTANATAGPAPTVTGSVTGVTATGWSMQLTVAQQGTYTVTVTDGSTISAPGTIVVSPVTANHVITPTSPGNVPAGSVFTFTGSLSGYATIPALTYVLNGNAAVAMTGVSLTGWSMSIVAPTAVGSANIAVSDGTQTVSVSFTITSAAKTITPLAPSNVIAGQSFTFTGVLSGYTTIPALSYRLNGGALVTMTGVSITGWAMTVTIATAGNYTIAVTDGTVTSQAVAFTVSNSSTTLRTWYLSPGMDNSFWVQPFQNSANWITTGALVTSLRSGTPSINLTGNFSPPWYVGKATDPLVTVTDGTHTIVVHIPLGAVVEGPASPFDQSIGGADATQPYLVWSISGASINTGSVAASGSVITGTYGFAVNDGSGLMMVDAVTNEPGDNNSFGNITDIELALIAAGKPVQHMLACQLDIGQSSSAGPIWPLLTIDGGATYTGPIPQGCTFGIPANVTRPNGMSAGEGALWDICQQFGLFTYNFGSVGGINLVINSFSGAYSTIVSQMVTGWPAVAANLCILNYNSGVSGAQYSLATTKGAIPGSTNAFPAPPPLDLSPTGGKNVAPSTFGAWYPSGYNVTPTNSTTGANFIISPNTPANVVAGTPFTFTGVLSGYATAPTLNYSVNGAAAVALSGVTSSGWSALITIATPGAATIVVTDMTNFVTGSTQFQVSSGSVTSSPVTWNPADLTAGIALSNGNYTATANGSSTPYSTPQGVRATIPLSPAQVLAWEITFVAITQNSSAGVTSSAHLLNQPGGMGSDTNSIGAYPSTGTGSQPAQTVYYNNNQLTAGNGVATTAGGAVSFVVNGANFYFSDAAMRSTSGVQWNNSTTADPVKNIGGLSFSGITGSYFPTFETGEGGAAATLNDGTSAFSSFLANYIAANPSVVSISGQKSVAPSKAITPIIPTGVIINAPFTFTGTLTGYTSIPTLTYSLNGAAATALSGVTSTGWSTTLVTSVSSNTIVVSDGSVTNQVSFTASTTASGNKVVAPLTGSVTTGTWSLNLRQNLANSPSGLGYMQYNVLPPAQYNPSLIYPVLFVGHPNDNGMNGSSYPKDGSSFVTGAAYGGSYSLDTMYNSVAFRTAHPCFVVACQCDQSLDLSGANSNANFGGYNDSQNSGWNENAVNAVFATVAAAYPIDRSQCYHIGYSLGGIGTLAQLVDNNVYNGPGLKQWVAGATFSDQLYRPSTPNANVFSRMSSVPLFVSSTTSDNVPSSYDEPAWTSYTGNSNYPTQSAYDSGGMAAIRAGTTNFYYINYGSSNPATTFMPMNALGGDGDKIYAWLFSQVAGGASAPTITGVSFAPAASILPNSAIGTVAGSLTAGASNGALSGITYSLSSTTNFKISGSNVVFASGGVGSGTYPLTVTVTATNASNSPQSYSISLTVSGGTGTGSFYVSNGQILNLAGKAIAPVGLNINNDQLNSSNANVTSIQVKFPGTGILRVPFHAYNSAASMQSAFTQLTAAGIILVVEDHTSIGQQPYTGSQLTAQLAFYTDFASTYKSNPYVWFGSQNEAYPTSSGNGDDVTTSHIEIYNAVRNAGATSPILLTEIGGGNPTSLPGGSGPQLTASRYATLSNIVWDYHFYNWTTGYSGSQSVIQSDFNGFIAQCQQIRSADGLVPVIVGEYGVSTTGNLPDDTGGTLLVGIVLASGLPSMAWAWNAGGASDNLTNGTAGVGGGSLTTYGLQVAAGIAAASPAAPTPPAQASAVGYNTLAFGPNLVLNKTVIDPSSSFPVAGANGSNIYPYTFFGASWKDIAQGITQNSDGSISMTGINSLYGGGMSLAIQGQNGSTNRLTFTGVAFGGGAYFECVMQGNGPMSFWSNDIESMNGASLGLGQNPWAQQSSPNYPAYRDSIEADMAEFDTTGNYGWSPHNWYNSTSDVAPNWGGPLNNFNGPPPGVDYTQYNKYGMLWVPATTTTPGYLQMYFNDVAVGNKMQYNKYNPALPPPPVAGAVTVTGSVYNTSTGYTAPNSAWSVIDTLHLALIFGAQEGGGDLVTFKSCSVWQANTSGNLYGTGP